MSEKPKCGCYMGDSSKLRYSRERQLNYDTYYCTKFSKKYLCENCHEYEFIEDCDFVTTLKMKICAIENLSADVKKMLDDF